jgi:hypothetical protein
MPVDYYPNSNEDELVLLLESLQRRATTGQIYMTTYSGDQNMRTFQGASPVKVEIKNVLYSLHLQNPADWDNPHLQKIRRVRAAYS